MRDLRLLALLVPVLLLPLACEDTGSSSGGEFNPEAGLGFEAGPAPPTPEGGVPEAGADAFVPPVPKGVTVTVTNATGPMMGVRVILHDAAGAVTGDMKTDATGKVAVAAAPSMITVLIMRPEEGDRPEAVTFAAVEDGDNLIVALPPEFSETPVGSYSVPFTSGPFSATATNFEVVAGGGCFGYGSDVAVPVNVSVYPYCLGATNAVLARATTADGAELGFGFAKNLAKPALNATVNVPSIAFAAPGQTTLTASNIPAGTSRGSQLFAIANGASFFASEKGEGTLDAGGVDFHTATGFAEAYQSQVLAQTFEVSKYMARGFIRREATMAPANATLANFDFATALPLIQNATLVNPTPARPDVTLTAAASLAPADGALVKLDWNIAALENSGSWTFVLPPSTTVFKVPALPGDASAFVPTASVEISDVVFVEATQLPSYKELKMLPISPSGDVDLVIASTPLPSAGTVRFTRWSQGRGGEN